MILWDLPAPGQSGAETCQHIHVCCFSYSTYMRKRIALFTCVIHMTSTPKRYWLLDLDVASPCYHKLAWPANTNSLELSSSKQDLLSATFLLRASHRHLQERKNESWKGWADLVSEGAYCQDRSSGFDSRDPRGGRREQNPASCPLTSEWASTHTPLLHIN